MESQLPLFAEAPRRIETPAARSTDPITSHLAAEQHTASGKRAYQQALTVATVKAFPGLTSFDMAMKSGHDRHMIARRLPECRTAGKVRNGEPVRCGGTGRMALTWFPA